VKVYRPSTAQLLSTLMPEGGQPTGRVTALMINASNPLQLHVASDDGVLRTWDYLEGRQIRYISLGFSIDYMCGHDSAPETLYVASKRVRPKKSIPYGAPLHPL
jgi:NET1-associated nuclear protein 1 (U3 small nucleolar RNA-associated protein 17)